MRVRGSRSWRAVCWAGPWNRAFPGLGWGQEALDSLALLFVVRHERPCS